jgi:5-formyltetrahydrofolate cyclo-ligase
MISHIKNCLRSCIQLPRVCQSLEMTASGIAVALSSSLQIMDEGIIPVTPTDIPVDALVSPTGVIPISQAALDR